MMHPFGQADVLLKVKAVGNDNDEARDDVADTDRHNRLVESH